MSIRNVAFLVNPSRPEAISAAGELAPLLFSAGFSLYTISDIDIEGIKKVAAEDLPEIELAVVLGGDGTILRAAEVTLTRKIPLLGINLGNVGFLAEVDRPTIKAIAQSIIDKSYVSENRMVLQFEIERGGKVVSTGWALNEVTVERDATTMVELFVEIDRRPLSHWGCDGVICSTPTGSTAYAFSAGGPVLWPEIEALVLLPISAHALFARPMVVSPKSEIIITVESSAALLSADALRKTPLQLGDRVIITRDERTIMLSHVSSTLFTDRLVAKFKLPIEGWRGE
ncbi:NAD kinase [Candidatus Planktophila versatilis]|uniref:NAD kinase n=1 Tax=Candidatus Planktophila versatilis TaxID=1884905 RepID=A0ABN5BGX8_9ACTN|nr:NAD kinase [Candidatus Planktophila versatilis]ASY17213.1 NAD+ kinase [Candidatus Planktophila versatilis]